MTFRLNEEQLMLQNSVCEFVQKEVRPYVNALNSALLPPKEISPKELFPWDLWKKMHSMGLLTLPIPQEWGGAGASLHTQAIVCEELGKAVGGPFISLQLTYEHFLNIWGNNEQKEEFLTQCVKDPAFIIANCTTEEESASDITLPYDEPGVALKTFAYRDGEQYVINGSKRHISFAPLAKLFIVWCRTDKSKPVSQAMSGFLVPGGTPGLSIGHIDETLGTPLGHKGINAEVIFDNVRVPIRYRLGTEGGMWSTRMKEFCFHDILMLAHRAGILQAVFDETLEYAKTRIQGGKPIVQHINIGVRLADMLATVETCRLYYQRLAWDWDNLGKSEFDRHKVYLFRGFVTDMITKFFLDALEIWGGVGVQRETPFHRYLADHFSTLHAAGSPVQMRLRVMKWLTGEKMAFS